MRELVVFLLVSLLLVSCAARRTAAYKPYDPDDPVDTDIETCKRSAAEQERSIGPNVKIFRKLAIWGSGFAIALFGPLGSLLYEKAKADDIEKAFRTCMNKKGYDPALVSAATVEWRALGYFNVVWPKEQATIDPAQPQ